MFIHATCVAIENKGVLLVGPSGVGKSDVALRLIDDGAELVSDDQTELRLDGEKIIASPPVELAGLLEIRPVGLLRMSCRACVEVALYVELVTCPNSLQRLPKPSFHSLLDRPVRALKLAGYAASTPAIVRAVLKGKIEDV